jgi:hypothetical protein
VFSSLTAKEYKPRIKAPFLPPSNGCPTTTGNHTGARLMCSCPTGCALARRKAPSRLLHITPQSDAKRSSAGVPLSRRTSASALTSPSTPPCGTPTTADMYCSTSGGRRGSSATRTRTSARRHSRGVRFRVRRHLHRFRCPTKRGMAPRTSSLASSMPPTSSSTCRHACPRKRPSPWPCKPRCHLHCHLCPHRHRGPH